MKMRLPEKFSYSEEIGSREEFGMLLNRRELFGIAVEIGTNRGDFAVALLKSWKLGVLTCVDPWETAMQDYVDLLNAGGRDRLQDELAAMKALEPYGQRVSILKKTSVEACKNFSDSSLDFVYVDANHDKKYVEQDLALWWPKLKTSGILSGHDILTPGEKGGGWQKHVLPAVHEFSQREDVEIKVTRDIPASWYTTKK